MDTLPGRTTRTARTGGSVATGDSCGGLGILGGGVRGALILRFALRVPRVAVGGLTIEKGGGPSAVDSTPPGAVPTYSDPGQQGNDLSRSRGDRIRWGAGLFPSGFPNPPTTCLNFSLWRDLSVWRIRGGYVGHRRSGWGGVY